MNSAPRDESLLRLSRRVAGLADREMRQFSGPDLAVDVETQQTQQKSLEPRHIASSDVLRLILTTVGHGVDIGAEDKRLWQVRFAYRGQEFLMFFGKSGLRLRGIVAEDVETAYELLVDEIDNKLTRAVASVMEHGVQPLIDVKLQTNDAIVVNQHARYLAMFEYFRSLLRHMQLSELEIEKMETNSAADAMMSALSEVVAMRAKEDKIAHLAIATIAAYFSMLEHRFVLLGAFREDILVLDFSLTTVLRARWREKFEFAFGGLPRKSRTGHLNDLEYLSETYRNPLLHGGGGGTTDGLIVEWLPHFRSVVSARGKITDKYMLWTSAISVCEADDILRRIDSLEVWMQKMPGYAWVKEGLAVDFKKASLATYSEHLADGTLEGFVAGSSDQFDRGLNFE
ncbi:hypothetical protein AB6813_21530 [bacterium RCC_150]